VYRPGDEYVSYGDGVDRLSLMLFPVEIDVSTIMRLVPGFVFDGLTHTANGYGCVWAVTALCRTTMICEL